MSNFHLKKHQDQNVKRCLSSLTKRFQPIKYHGLYNQGSTCYLNSVLQVLFMTEDFREAVKRHQCDNHDGIDGSLKKLFQDLEQYPETTYKITDALGIKTVRKQDDAAQCFEKILRNLTVPGASQIFQGELTHRNICSGCERDTNQPEPFWSLPLELVHSNYSVVEGIDSYFCGSTFTGLDQLYCETCQTKRDATAKCEMTKTPEVLTLLLKRFEFDAYFNRYVKISCDVTIPYTLERPEKYELYAFVELKSGHYCATIKPPGDDSWYRFDDTTVHKLEFQPFQVDPCYRSNAAYLLFYRKRHAEDTDPDKVDTSQSASSDNRVEHATVESSQRGQREQAAGVPGGKKNSTKNNQRGKDRSTEGVKVERSGTAEKEQAGRRGEMKSDPKHSDRKQQSDRHDKPQSRDREESGEMKSGRHKPAAKNYHGLYNQGATCYLNSVLQVLFMTEDFREAVKSHQCDNHKGIDGSLKKLFQDLERYPETTYKITDALGIKTVRKQDDAAQCFEKILRNLTVPEASQIFQGELTHRNICSGCGPDTNQPEPFWSLPLELVHSNYSVVEGIDSYFCESKFTGLDQLYCETCQDKRDAKAKCDMTKAPEVLTLLLKRFEFDAYFNKFVKIHCDVNIPYTLETPEKYELYAFVEHFGELKNGHYCATIKPPGDDSWYRFNDSTVRKLEFQPFQVDPYYRSSTAYLLFYRKRHAEDTDPGKVDTSQSASSDNRVEHAAVEISQRGEREEAAGVPGGKMGTKKNQRGKDRSTDGVKEVRTRTAEKEQAGRRGEMKSDPKHSDRTQRAVTCQTQTEERRDSQSTQDYMSNTKPVIEKRGNVEVLVYYPNKKLKENMETNIKISNKLTSPEHQKQGEGKRYDLQRQEEKRGNGQIHSSAAKIQLGCVEQGKDEEKKTMEKERRKAGEDDSKDKDVENVNKLLGNVSLNDSHSQVAQGQDKEKMD